MVTGILRKQWAFRKSLPLHRAGPIGRPDDSGSLLPAGILPFASHDTDREVILPAECQDDVVFSSQWEEQGGCLRRDFRFVDFATAFAFMTRVAELAEEQNHHPDWSNSWNRVVIELRSHDVGAITDRDHRLAEAIDRIADGFR